MHSTRLRPLGGIDNPLEMEKDICNIISKYSPDYVKSRVLRGPGDAALVAVSNVADKAQGVMAGPVELGSVRRGPPGDGPWDGRISLKREEGGGGLR